MLINKLGVLNAKPITILTQNKNIFLP